MPMETEIPSPPSPMPILGGLHGVKPSCSPPLAKAARLQGIKGIPPKKQKMGLLHPSFLPKNAQKRKSIGARRKDRSGGDSNFFSLGAPFSLGAAVNYPSPSGCPVNTAAKEEKDQTSQATCGFASFFLVDIFCSTAAF